MRLLKSTLRIKPRSYQSHEKRSEFWRCIKNSVIAVINEEVTIMKDGDEVRIPPGTKHRLIGGAIVGQVLEISFGEFDEEDIVRYEDDYGRGLK